MLHEKRNAYNFNRAPVFLSGVGISFDVTDEFYTCFCSCVETKKFFKLIGYTFSILIHFKGNKDKFVGYDIILIAKKIRINYNKIGWY